MATWEKIKFYWQTMLGSTGSTLTASSTDSTGDFDVNYIHNMMETNQWKGASAADPHYITYDAGAGNTKTADYFAVLGHNLKSAGVTTLSLQYSDDGTIYTDAFTPVNPQTFADDKVYLKEFTGAGAHRYWRVNIVGLTIPVYMAVCIWGNATELDYASASYDPHGQEVKANVNLSYGGFVAGVHTKFIERRMSLRFRNVDAAFYTKIKDWWEGSGLKNFFVAWERGNNPAEVFLMRPEATFRNPLTDGGAYRDITINLKGRKE